MTSTMTSLEEKEMLESMTLDSAVKAVGNEIKDPNIQALIQKAFHQGKGRKLRSSSKALTAKDPTGYSGVEGAIAKLNEMILESEQKLDLAGPGGKKQPSSPAYSNPISQERPG